MSHCLACLKRVPDGAPFYPDDMETGEPLTMVERRALYDAHLAAGGKADDSMARA